MGDTDPGGFHDDAMFRSHPDGRSAMNGPVWGTPPESAGDDVLPTTCDDLVIGAGIAGLSTAVLLARAGRRVCVLEARYVGAGTTAHSSAKVTLLQGTRLSDLLTHHDADVVRSYLDANRAGFDWLVRFCDEHDVRIDRRPATTFAANPGQVSQARAEFVAARELGLPVRWIDSLDVSFPTHGAVILDDQAQVDPTSMLTALVAELREYGGALVDRARVDHVNWFGPPKVRLSDGREVSADTVVVTTGSPILDRSLAFTDLQASRSYVVAYELEDPPEVMGISAGSPVVSIRDAATSQGRRVLLVGGQGHVVGRTDSEREHVEVIRTWTAEHFPAAREITAWSAQDHRTANGLPHFGAMPRGGGRIRYATGFAKWGFTNGPAAAIALSHQIVGGSEPWMEALSETTSPLTTARQRVGTNAAVAREVVTGLARALSPSGHGADGDVHREGVRIVAESGRGREVSGLCTHLGGVLRWNDAEGTWDCPLHGSRFSADGDVLDGPATRRLPCWGDSPPPGRTER